MTTIDLPNPTPSTRTGHRMRPLYFALPVAGVLALAIAAYGQRSSTNETPGRGGGPPPAAAARLTAPKAELPQFPAQPALEARAAAFPADQRAERYFGYDVKAQHPFGWTLPEYEGKTAFPLFQWDGTTLVGFWIDGGERVITPAEYTDPNFDADNLVPVAERAKRLQVQNDINQNGPKK